MARKDEENTLAEAEAADAAGTETDTINDEATAAAVSDAMEASTEGTETPTEKVEPDLTAFIAAADAAVVSGEYEAVNAEYNKLERAGKSAATSHVNGQIKANLTAKTETDEQKEKAKDLAFAWGQLGQALKTVKAAKAKEPKAPVNRTEVVVDQLASLYLAYTTAKAAVNPEGLDTDWADKVVAKVTEVGPQVEQLVAWRNLPEPAEGTEPTPEPEVSDVARRAVRLAFQGGKTSAKSGGKASTGGGSTYAGPRRSIHKHISEAFAGHPVGTFLSVAAIRSFESSEYGTDLPSAGAISAAMKSPKWADEHIVPGKGGEKDTFGATKR